MELWVSLIAGASGGYMFTHFSRKTTPGFWGGSCLGGIGGILLAMALMWVEVSPMRDGGVDLVSLVGQICVAGIGGALAVGLAARAKQARKR